MPDALASSATLPSAHANRHAWALKKAGHLLAEALRKDTSAEARAVEKLPVEQIPAHIVSLILAKADPTQNKGMTAWLVGQYAQGKLRLEDLGTANETLMMFRRYGLRLEPTQRDLGKYQSLAAVWNAVIGFAEDEDQHLSGKAQKALDRDKAYAESRILRQDDDGFTVAVPLTEFAAKWWGKGTRWCTSADAANAFHSYHGQAPLVVIRAPGIGKFQMWSSGNIFEFRNAQDLPAGKIEIENGWQYFEDIFLFLISKNFSNAIFEAIPESRLSEKICIAALYAVDRPSDLYRLPVQARTYRVCLTAVQLDGENINFVPREILDKAICAAAVAKTGRSLSRVPMHFRTPEICEIAVRQDGGALLAVPKPQRNLALCELALPTAGWALGLIPEELRTAEMCEAAVERDGAFGLKHVPKKFLTQEICLKAMRNSHPPIYAVPKELLSEEICLEAVQNNGMVISHMPKEFQTERVCLAAVLSNPKAITNMKKKNITENVAVKSLAKYPHAIFARPKKRISKKVALAYLEAFNNHWEVNNSCGIGGFFSVAPMRVFDHEICKAAVLASPYRAIERVPRAILSEDILLSAAALAPEKSRDPETVFRNLPRRFHTFEFWSSLVKCNGEFVSLAPHKLRGALYSYAQQLKQARESNVQLERNRAVMGPNEAVTRMQESTHHANLDAYPHKAFLDEFAAYLEDRKAETLEFEAGAPVKISDRSH
jgi:hypothetical protein